MIRDLISISLQSARNRKLRSWLTIIGIVIGISAIIGLVTVSSGLETAITEQFNKMGTNRLWVIPKQGNFLSLGQDLTIDDVNTAEKMSEFKWITPYLVENTNVEFNRESHYRQVYSNPIDDIEARWADIDFNLKEGRLWMPNEKFSVIIGSSTAEDLFDKKIKVNNNLLINGYKFKVIGILKEFGDPESDNMIHIPIDTARKIFNKEKEVSTIELIAKQGIDLEKTAMKLAKNMKSQRHNENFEVKTAQQLMEQLGTLLDITKIIFISIVSISLVVGGIGIMNSMFTSVLERRQEIGIMKAIGATNKHIMAIFLTEAALFGLIGGIIGTILGSLGAYSIKLVASQFGFDMIKISISPGLILFSFAFAIGIGMISGAIPAYQAAKLKPVEALRYE